MREMISVILVDDSLTVRKAIKEFLTAESKIKVIAECCNGIEAVEKTLALSPDVIVMDLAMPKKDGVSATIDIMSMKPTPIIVLSGKNISEKYIEWDALAAGAVARICKDDRLISPSQWERELISTVVAASKIHVKLRDSGNFHNVRSIGAEQPIASNKYNLLLFGTSTGGPGTLQAILKDLPAPFPVPIIICQHFSSNAEAQSFIEWLNSQSKHTVIAVKDGCAIESLNGIVAVAPGEYHTVIEKRGLFLTKEAPIHSCRPSVDALFHSAAKESTCTPVAVLLTGIGSDGASGLKAIRNSGGYTICQDEESCVVFGMPKKGIELKAPIEVLTTEEITQRVTSLFANHKE